MTIGGCSKERKNLRGEKEVPEVTEDRNKGYLANMYQDNLFYQAI